MTSASQTTTQFLILGSMLLASACSAFAATPSASAANTSYLSYTLIDLDPSDNISASLSFTGSFSATVETTDSSAYNNYFSDQLVQVLPGQDGSISHTISFPDTTAAAHAAFSHSGGAWPDSFSSSASATFLSSSPVANTFSTDSHGFTKVFDSYVLSAHTQVIWTLDILNSATTLATSNYYGNFAGASGQLTVSADPGMTTFESGTSALDSFNSVTAPNLYRISRNQGFADVVTLTPDRISLAQYNTTSGDMTAYLTVATGSGVFASQPLSLSAVPEPGSCALMLAGLGALGMAGRRRGSGSSRTDRIMPG